jgi:hypothetical protein
LAPPNTMKPVTRADAATIRITIQARLTCEPFVWRTEP